MEFNLAVIKGDGIGPEVVSEAIKVIEAISVKFGHTFNLTEVLAGGSAIDAFGDPLPDLTLDVCKKSDSVILGAVGGPKWDSLPLAKRPERALLGLRKGLGLYANLRPAVLYDALKAACPLRADIADLGIDIMVVRELTGGMYFGERGRVEKNGETAAFDTETYAVSEIKRITKIAFEIARKRGKRVMSVDKANVLESSRLWREVVLSIAKDYPDVTLDHMYVDNAAMQLVRQPSAFDVLLTTNMFGDILSDEASQITGSIGLLPSASLGETKCGMYEPIHGSAPDIAGKNMANPIATILSIAMMFRYSLGLDNEAKAIEEAVSSVLSTGYRTVDIAYGTTENVLGTKEMGDLIVSKL